MVIVLIFCFLVQDYGTDSEDLMNNHHVRATSSCSAPPDLLLVSDNYHHHIPIKLSSSCINAIASTSTMATVTTSPTTAIRVPINAMSTAITNTALTTATTTTTATGIATSSATTTVNLSTANMKMMFSNTGGSPRYNHSQHYHNLLKNQQMGDYLYGSNAGTNSCNLNTEATKRVTISGVNTAVPPTSSFGVNSQSNCNNYHHTYNKRWNINGGSKLQKDLVNDGIIHTERSHNHNYHHQHQHQLPTINSGTNVRQEMPSNDINNDEGLHLEVR